MVLARRASYDKKTLARQVSPPAPGYRTALLSRPDVCSIRPSRMSLSPFAAFICKKSKNKVDYKANKTTKILFSNKENRKKDGQTKTFLCMYTLRRIQPLVSKSNRILISILKGS